MLVLLVYTELNLEYANYIKNKAAKTWDNFSSRGYIHLFVIKELLSCGIQKN